MESCAGATAVESATVAAAAMMALRGDCPNFLLRPLIESPRFLERRGNGSVSRFLPQQVSIHATWRFLAFIESSPPAASDHPPGDGGSGMGRVFQDGAQDLAGWGAGVSASGAATD